MFVFVFGFWLLLMALDAGRFHWTSVPPSLQGAGASAMLAAMWTILLPFGANPFLTKTVKACLDSGQRLAASGPCRFVRHPLYSALVILRISIPLVLGSLLGLIAAIAIVASLLLRRVIEDRDLHENVPGYADYSRRIHYRHIPSLW
jgi:protein-S-isoprenylcysteine O-methyltransferase Ste14